MNGILLGEFTRPCLVYLFALCALCSQNTMACTQGLHLSRNLKKKVPLMCMYFFCGAHLPEARIRVRLSDQKNGMMSLRMCHSTYLCWASLLLLYVVYLWCVRNICRGNIKCWTIPFMNLWITNLKDVKLRIWCYIYIMCQWKILTPVPRYLCVIRLHSYMLYCLLVLSI